MRPNCPENCQYNKQYRPVCYPNCENETNIRKNERDKVLDEIRIWAEKNSFRKDAVSINMLYTYQLAQFIEELRQVKE
jgi:hypothetical protein